MKSNLKQGYMIYINIYSLYIPKVVIALVYLKIIKTVESYFLYEMI